MSVLRPPPTPPPQPSFKPINADKLMLHIIIISYHIIINTHIVCIICALELANEHNDLKPECSGAVFPSAPWAATTVKV